MSNCRPRIDRVLVCLLAVMAAVLLSGCAVVRGFAPAVQARPMTPAEYIAVKRGDILTQGKLSSATLETISVSGLGNELCSNPGHACIEALDAAAGINDEQRQSALAELWLTQAQATCGREHACADGETAFAAWMEVARHSYSYLFFTERTASMRAFEDRQTQVRDYYNQAVQEVGRLLFVETQGGNLIPADDTVHWAGWNIRIERIGLQLPGGARDPKELVPAAALSFAGLRSIYRRDGFGAELVAVTADAPITATSALPDPDDDHEQFRAQWGEGAWSEVPATVISVLLRFQGGERSQVLATRDVVLAVHDAYGPATVELEGQTVPLAANFTAGYGLWLARSGFNKQSMRSLLGHEHGIDRPHLYLMQPFDPNRRIIVMIHGLASSPEAWANVANELMGDEDIRSHFQIWQFYYPTNNPIPFNHYAIRRTLQSALDHFDPGRVTPASQDMVIIGHSMGGVIARLMVSSSGDTLWQMAQSYFRLDDARLARAKASFGPVLSFEPIPDVDRVVFLATPHRGTEAAGGWLARRLAALIRLPRDLTSSLAQLVRPPDGDRAHAPKLLPNSVDELDQASPFIKAAADLPISRCVRYHSIIGRQDSSTALEQSSDGLVPYRSAHLEGAASETLIVSGHSVQETAPAIIELRRILHEDIAQRRSTRGCSADAVTEPAREPLPG